MPTSLAITDAILALIFSAAIFNVGYRRGRAATLSNIEDQRWTLKEPTHGNGH